MADPASVPTFFLGYLGEDVHAPRRALGRAGPRVGGPGAPATGSGDDEDGWLYFEGRDDDVIVSAGYRIGPFEVESALVSHPAVAEAAAVSAPDEERGAVVRAVVVLRDGQTPAAASPASSRSTSGARPRPTSTRASSISSTSSRRPPAARSAGAALRGPRAPDGQAASGSRGLRLGIGDAALLGRDPLLDLLDRLLHHRSAACEASRSAARMPTATAPAPTR